MELILVDLSLQKVIPHEINQLLLYVGLKNKNNFSKSLEISNSKISMILYIMDYVPHISSLKS